MSNNHELSEPLQIIERITELYGTDTYVLEGNSPEVHNITCEILNSVYPVCGASDGKVIQWSAIEHNRSYGNHRRISLALVVSIPKQRENSRLLSKSRRQTDGNQTVPNGGIPGQGELNYDPTNGDMLTDVIDAANLVPGSGDNEAPPKKRGKVV